MVSLDFCQVTAYSCASVTRRPCLRQGQRAIAAPPRESEYNSGSGEYWLPVAYDASGAPW